MGEYKIVRELGRGTFGRVVLVQHRVNGELAAMKLLPRGLLVSAAAAARAGGWPAAGQRAVQARRRRSAGRSAVPCAPAPMHRPACQMATRAGGAIKQIG